VSRVVVIIVNISPSEVFIAIIVNTLSRCSARAVERGGTTGVLNQGMWKRGRERERERREAERWRTQRLSETQFDPKTQNVTKRVTRRLRDGGLPGAHGRPAEQMPPLES
jgi:hypothetical protein